jgi:hypothetical protein
LQQERPPASISREFDQEMPLPTTTDSDLLQERNGNAQSVEGQDQHFLRAPPGDRAQDEEAPTPERRHI